MADPKGSTPAAQPQTDAGASAAVPALATGAAAAAAAAVASATPGGAQSAAAPGTGVGSAPGTAAAGTKPKKSKGKAKAAPVPLTAEEAAALAVQQAAEQAALEVRQAIEDIPHQQMVKARRMDVAGRNTALVSSVSALQSRLQQSEQDSTDVLKYLEHEVRRKDILTKKLAREIRQLHEAQVKEKEERNKAYASEIADMERNFARAEKELLDLNRLRHQEHNDLLLFARIRADLVAELAASKRVILKNQQRHELQMSDLEKKFLAARQRLLEESVARIAASRAAYKEEVGRELDLESKWIQAENEKMGQELAFHQALIEKLQASNAQLDGIVAQLESAVRALEEKDTSYAASALRDGKMVAELQNKHALLTASIEQVRRETAAQQQARPPLASDPTLVPMHTELTKLEALSALKQRENDALHRQICLFRSQQNDVECAALDALARVKREVVARRQAAYKRQVQDYRRDLARLAEGMYQPRGVKRALGPGVSESRDGGSDRDGRLGAGAAAPTLHIQSDPRIAAPTPPVLDESRVTLDDLTLHDRERVLHLLFEKLNQSTTGGAPSHAHAAADSANSSRPSSALSLYTGGRRAASASSSSATSLVVSRPHSSTRSRPGSRPLSSTMRAPPAAGTSAAAAAARSRAAPSAVAQVDIRPSEFTQLSGLSAAAGIGPGPAAGGRGQRLKQQRSVDEKEMYTFFPPRGDTPTELL